MKPDWNDAPEWAEWLAMDDDGAWYWYGEKPELVNGTWRTDGEVCSAYCQPDLEQRPS